jgi:L-ribulose-5-phosphate 4-epimerase
MPAVLVAGHGPFAWGRDAGESVKNAVALEAVAAMAKATLTLRREPVLLEQYVLDKHFRRKHGESAYYGQRPTREN